MIQKCWKLFFFSLDMFLHYIKTNLDQIESSGDDKYEILYQKPSLTFPTLVIVQSDELKWHKKCWKLFFFSLDMFLHYIKTSLDQNESSKNDF